MKTVLLIVLVALFIVSISANGVNCNNGAAGNVLSMDESENILSFETEVMNANKKVTPNSGNYKKPTIIPKEAKPIKWDSKLGDKNFGNTFKAAIKSGTLTGKETLQQLARFGMHETKKDELDKCLVGNEETYFCYMDCKDDIETCNKLNKVLAVYVKKQEHIDLCVAPRIKTIQSLQKRGTSKDEEGECYFRPCSCRVFEKKFMQDDMNLYKAQIKMYQGVCGKWCETNAPPTAGIPFEIAEHQIRTLKKKIGLTFFAKTPLTKATLDAAKIDPRVILRGKHLDAETKKYAPYFRFFVPFNQGRTSLKNGIKALIAKIPLFAAIAKKADFITKFANFQKKFKVILTPKWIGSHIKKAQKKIAAEAKKVAANVKKFGKIFGNKIGREFKKIGNFGKKIGKNAKKFAKEFGQNAKKFGKKLGLFGKKVGKKFENFGKKIGQGFKKTINKFKNFGKKTKRRFGKGLKKFKRGVGKKIKGVKTNVKRLGRYFGNNAKKSFTLVRNRFNNVRQKTGRTVRKVVTKTKQRVVKVAKKVRHVATKVRNNIRKKFTGFKKRFVPVKQAVTRVRQAVQNRVSQTVGSFKRFGGGVARRAGSVFRRIKRW